MKRLTKTQRLQALVEINQRSKCECGMTGQESHHPNYCYLRDGTCGYMQKINCPDFIRFARLRGLPYESS